MLFSPPPYQLITSCKNCIMAGRPQQYIWDQDYRKLMTNLNSCLRLNSAYQSQYALTKAKLLTMPKGKQFDFSESRVRDSASYFRNYGLPTLFVRVPLFESRVRRM